MPSRRKKTQANTKSSQPEWYNSKRYKEVKLHAHILIFERLLHLRTQLDEYKIMRARRNIQLRSVQDRYNRVDAAIDLVSRSIRTIVNCMRLNGEYVSIEPSPFILFSASCVHIQVVWLSLLCVGRELRPNIEMNQVFWGRHSQRCYLRAQYLFPVLAHSLRDTPAPFLYVSQTHDNHNYTY